MALPKHPPDLGVKLSLPEAIAAFSFHNIPMASLLPLPLSLRTPIPHRLKHELLPDPIYVGSHLFDPSASDSLPSSDAEEFERSKMEMQITKILEFHKAATQADVPLMVEDLQGQEVEERQN